MAELDPEDRARKERSPSFPFIPLRKAIQRAQTMLGAHRKSPTRPSVVGETWGYSPASSGLVQTIAALKAYGLLDDVGKGEDRRVQLSELALRLLTDQRHGARDAAIEEAALKPRLFSEYAQSWLPERPSDAHCLSELTLDRGFTPDAAKLFLRTFDDNAIFAALKEDDKEEPVSSDAGTKTVREEHMVDAADRRGPLPGPELAMARDEPKHPTATLPLPEGTVTLSLPAGLSERSVRALKAWIDVVIDLASWQLVPNPNSDTLKM